MPRASTSSDRRAAPRSGSTVASARITSGACSPLAPCTVITRTASSGADGSRLISTSPRSNQSRKRCSDGVASALEIERGVEQFLDRIARFLARAGASSLRRPSSGPDRISSRNRYGVAISARAQHRVQRREPLARAGSRADAATALPALARRARHQLVLLQPISGETSSAGERSDRPRAGARSGSPRADPAPPAAR